ncbi:MAG: NAD(+)/NADH kinase [Desulfovibrionaceae bacterium]
MHGHIGSMLVITRAGDPDAAALGAEIAAYLESRAVSATICEHRTDVETAEAQNPERPFDLVLVLGGDGTYISVARRLYALQIPILGLNLGRVGFLADLPRERWPELLDDLLARGVRARRLRMLAYRLLRGGGQAARGVAVNDVVIGRGRLARLVRLELRLDGRSLGVLRADGVIVSTPTGSTAYSISAGGPIVHPQVNALCVTPICPFLSGYHPLVLPDDRTVTVRVIEARGEVTLTEDGQETLTLRPGDEVALTRSATDLLAADLDGQSFVERITSRGIIAER